jgi:tetratricopeptide (TPR) repeat protein
MMRFAVRMLVIFLALAGLVDNPGHAAGPDSGRRHAAKANRLSARNKCKPAIPEFTKAYRLLHDPVLLFNRAECYRKLGKNEEAIKDYQDFLAGAPNVPNRASVEARIASLRESMDSSGAEPAPSSETPAAAQAPAAKAVPAAPAEPSAPASKWGDDAFVAPAKAPAGSGAAAPPAHPVAPPSSSPTH